MQYIPLNFSPVLREIIFKLRMSPAPLKKPAAFGKVGAAVITEAANAPRTNRLDKLLLSVVTKINFLLTNKFYQTRISVRQFIA